MKAAFSKLLAKDRKNQELTPIVLGQVRKRIPEELDRSTKYGHTLMHSQALINTSRMPVMMMQFCKSFRATQKKIQGP